MALWGKRDTFSIIGTVDVNNTETIVVGTDTAFTANLDIGDMITISSNKYKVVAIANDTYLTIDPAFSGSNVSGGTITGQDTPKYLTPADGRKTYGVDTTEAEATTKDAGWVLRNTYTDVHGRTRDKREVLVAMSSISADEEDTVYPDTVITINTQPSNAEEADGDPVTFTVVASTLPAGTTINYRWQAAANANVAFSNLSDGVTGGGGNYANTNTATLEIDDNSGLNGYIYRVQLSAAGVTANTVSANATLTFSA
jgi:hypothetical protein